MAVYTVHAPQGYGADVRIAPDRIVFVRDGFHVWALLASALWLLWHRLWLALLGYVLFTLALETVLRILDAGTGVWLAVMGVVALWMGFEAASLRRWTYSRRKWRQIGLVVADDEQEAERLFFARHTAHAESGRGLSPSLPPLPPLPGASLGDDAAGFFPAAGMPR